MAKTNYSQVLFIFIFLLSITLSGCATLNEQPGYESIPVLSQDEIIRPYVKLGRIQVTRETFTSDYSMSPNIQAWGISAVRQEAERMGADAIIIPEVTGRTTTYGPIPSTEYVATGFAIKFK